MSCHAKEISSRLVTRGYTCQVPGMKRFRRATFGLQTWNPCFTVSEQNEGAVEVRSLLSNQQRDPTLYFQPWDKAPYDPSNAGGDHATPFRQDYSVTMDGAGVDIEAGAGIDFDLHQETTDRCRLISVGKYCQIILTNTQGRLNVSSVMVEAIEGPRRHGTLA